MLLFAILISLALFSKKKGKKTALFIAAENGHVEVCRLLVSHGADPSIKDMVE